MSQTANTPWSNPPDRDKPLRRKRAEKAARQAEFWGRRLAAVEAQGPEAVASVTWDRARGALSKLPQADRDRAYEALIKAIDRIRETYAL